MTDDDWTERANCRTRSGRHHEWAFVENVKSQREFARRVCLPCPVRHECLLLAYKFEVGPISGLPIRKEDRHGVWGGLTPGARARDHQRRVNEME